MERQNAVLEETGVLGLTGPVNNTRKKRIKEKISKWTERMMAPSRDVIVVYQC
jgi:hypothetical protein